MSPAFIYFSPHQLLPPLSSPTPPPPPVYSLCHLFSETPDRSSHLKKKINLLFFLAIPCVLWDLSSPTRDRTRALALKALSPNHWTDREFPGLLNFGLFLLHSTLYQTIRLIYLKSWTVNGSLMPIK